MKNKHKRTWKRCTGCQKPKPLSMFRTTKKGPRAKCKSCEREIARSYARIRRDPEKHAESSRKYRATHRERCNQQHLSWRQRNRDKFNATMRRAKLLRKADKDPELLTWVKIILADPCAYCGEPSDSIEHVVPVSTGGENSCDNIVGACFDCNRRKNNRDLLTFLAA